MSGVVIKVPVQAGVKIYAGTGTPGANGRGITGTAISDGRLLITYTDGDIEDAGAVKFIASIQIVSGDLVITYNDGDVVNMGRVTGTDGASGNGITAITQPTSNIMRVATRDLAPVDITLIAGNNGTNGATWYFGTTTPSDALGVNTDLHLNTVTWQVSVKVAGAWVAQGSIKGDKGDTGDAGPSSLLAFINKPSFIDHLMPIGTNGGIFTTNFQAIIRSGSGTVAFRNNQTIGGSGQITLSKGTTGSSDLVIRRSAGLSGARIGATAIDYVFCFYSDNLPTSIDNSVLRLCAQNDATPSITPSNRTGFYVDFGWSVDGVKATFSCFNNTVSTVILDTLSLATGTLYAVRVRVSSTTAQLYINGVLRQTINTNLPVFAPIQMSVGLARTGNGSVVSYTIDALASESTEPQSLYTI